MSNSLQERLSGLDGITVAILSLKYENSYRYVDAHEKGRIAWVTPCSETKIGISDWAHFILHHIEENHVLFESVRFPGYYLDMNHLKFDSGDHIVKISMSKGDTTKETWPKFSIHSDSNSDFYKGELKSIYNVAIRSDRYDNRWLDTAPKGSARTFEKRSRQISGGGSL